MPITLQELRQNAKAAYQKLLTPVPPLFETSPEGERERAKLREQVRRARGRFLDGSLVGELRKIAREWNVEVPQIRQICGGR